MAAVEVGGVHLDLAVEAAGAQQRGVEHVGPVGGGDEDDAAADVEAVHLHQELVQGLLALVVTAAHAGAAVAADGVDLVDEDDRRGVLLGLLEQVTDAGGADADEHLDEVGARDRVERHARLARDRAGEQRLAGAGRAVEQHALGDLGAHGLELGGLLQELLDLAELLDRLLTPRDVAERRLGHVLGDQLGLGAGELHDALAAAALDLVHQEDEEEHDEREGQQRGEDRAEQAGLRVLGVGLLDGAVGDRLPDLLEDALLLAQDVVGLHLAAAVPLDPLVEGGLDQLVAVDERDLLDLPRGDVLLHLGGRDLVGPVVGREVLKSQEHAHDGKDDPQPRTLEQTLHKTLSGTPRAGHSSEGSTVQPVDNHHSLRENASRGVERSQQPETASGHDQL